MMSFLATAMMAIGALAADPQPVEWQANYGDALEATRTSEEKPLLVVLDEPQAEETRVQPALLEGKADAKEVKLLKHYRLVHIDASTKYGRKVAGAFRAKRFPHMAIIDKSGKVVIVQEVGQDQLDRMEQCPGSPPGRRAGQSQARQLQAERRLGRVLDARLRNNSYCPSCQRNR